MSQRKQLAASAFILLGALVLFVKLDKTLVEYRGLATIADARPVKARVCEGVGTADSVVDQDQRDSFDSKLAEIRGSYSSKNQIKAYWREGQDAGTTAVNIVMGPAVIMAFAILSFLGYLCYYVHCVCEPCCPPCKKCCKCCRQEVPYTKLELGWPAIGSAVFLGMIAIVAIIGLAESGSLHESFLALNCAVIGVFDSLTFGASGWVGIDPLATKIVNFNGTVNTFLNSINTTFGQNDWVQTDRANVNSAVATLKAATDVNGSFTYDKNPENGNSTVEVSTFFTSSTFNTSVDAIQAVVDGAMTAIEETVVALENQATGIGNSSSSFSSAITTGADSLNSIVQSLADFIISTDDSTSSADQVFALITTVLNAIYGAFLGVSIIAGVCGVLLIVFKFYKLRVVLHVCWIVFSIVMIFTFMFSGIFLAVCIVGFDICEILRDFLNSEAEFLSYNDLVPTDIANKIKICKAELGGNGSILSEFGIDQTMNDVNDLGTQLNNFSSQAGNESSNSNDTSATVGQVDNILNLIAVNRDTSTYGTEHIMLATSLTSLNSTINGCGTYGTSEGWVTGPTDCGTTETTWDNSGTNKCYWVGGDPTVTANATAGAIVTQNNIATRYTSCTAARDKLWAVIQWRDEKNHMFTTKYTDTTAVKTNLNQFITDLNSYQNNITTFLGNAGLIITNVTDLNEGILADVNCLFLGRELDNMYDAICVSFFANFYGLTRIFMALSFGMFFCSFFLFCTAMRYSRQGKLEELEKRKKVQPTPMNVPL